MRKRSLLLFTACMLAAGMLAGCSSGSEETAAATTQAPQTAAETEAETETETENSSAESEETTSGETTSEETGAEEASAEGGEGKTLVVYFSATGNTERVAQVIAETTGGDLFELEPVDPYTSDDLNWTDDNSRVSQEHADESLRDVELVADTVDNWDQYDTVFIGYPIWWGIAAWPVDGFVEANDFSGKTVIPFCTSSSSGLGESGQLLADMAGTGDWQEGQRFRSGASQEDVQSWVEGLGL